MMDYIVPGKMKSFCKQNTDQMISGLKDAILGMVKNGLHYESELNVSGLLGITLDQKQVLLINIQEIVNGKEGNKVMAKNSKDKKRRRKSATVTKVTSEINNQLSDEEDNDDDSAFGYSKHPRLSEDLSEGSHIDSPNGYWSEIDYG